MIIYKNKKQLKVTALGITLMLCINTLAFPLTSMAQEMPFMPVPGTMVEQSNAFIPIALKGLQLNNTDPFQFNFIIDTGNSKKRGAPLKDASMSLIKYFLAALAIPTEDQWVNLSPIEENRIITDSFASTQMGRDLLAQDYLLKQFSASSVNPQNSLGKEFWNNIEKKLGDFSLPKNSLTKIWIVPDRAVVYEAGNSVFVGESTLKVMVEEDYQALKTQKGDQTTTSDAQQKIASEIIRKVIIPQIEKEVNIGQNFAPLRQIYHAVILAQWYKRNLKSSILTTAYVGQKKIDGIDLDEPSSKEDIYQQYMHAFQKGAFNLISDDYDASTQTIIPKHYFAGGMNIAMLIDEAMLSVKVTKEELFTKAIEGFDGNIYNAKIKLDLSEKKEPQKDFALLTGAFIPETDKYREFVSGEEIVMRLVIDNDQIGKDGIIGLATNLTGEWLNVDGAVQYVYEDNQGRKVYEAKVRIKTDGPHEFNYTFYLQDPNTGEVQWVNNPGADGSVKINTPFKGRVVNISMEYGGPLGQKAGGQGDVVYGKSTKLAQLNPKNPPISIIPAFKTTKGNSITEKQKAFDWEPVEGFSFAHQFKRKGTVNMTAERSIVEGVEIYRLNIDSDEFFQELYAGEEIEFYESILLSKGALELLKHLKEKKGLQFDVIESHDHHAALALGLMRTQEAEFFKNTGHLMLIHNMGYQGRYPQEWFEELKLAGLPDYYFDIINNKQDSIVNMMAISASLLGAGNHAVTVSPTYANHILQSYKELGFLLDTLLAEHPEYFSGMLNGLSDEWNPQTDQIIKNYKDEGFVNFSSNNVRENIEQRKRNKTALQNLLAKDAQNIFTKKRTGFIKEDSQNMLIASSNRLESQKQMDILEYILYKARSEGKKIDFIILGDGEEALSLQKAANEINEDLKSSVNVIHLDFDSDMEHLLLAGADLCLAPSDFEPGGLAHLKGMLYGAVPDVRWTGGLADTVVEKGDRQTGFGFSGVSRAFDNKYETEQIKGILQWVNDWDAFMWAIDYQLSLDEETRGRKEVSTVELYEAIGRAFQMPGIIADFVNKDQLFWEDANGWALAQVDTIRRGVNERQFYRSLMRAYDIYEQEPEKYIDISANAMERKVYWDEKIKGYYTVYQQVKDETNPNHLNNMEIKFIRGTLDHVVLFMEQGKINMVYNPNYHHLNQFFSKTTQLQDYEEVHTKKQLTDQAMLQREPVGGIDFDARNLDLVIHKKNDHHFTLNAELMQSSELKIDGLTPIMLDFTPVTNLPQLLNTN